MRAIIETGGKQFTVAPDKRIRVPSLAGEPGDRVTFDRVLYAADDDGVRVGTPSVSGATVTAEIVKHGRGEKIVVYKMKRRKRYRRKQGHRQGFTELKILEVDVASGGGAEPAAEETGFACPTCGKSYATERGLNQHVSLAHKDE